MDGNSAHAYKSFEADVLYQYMDNINDGFRFVLQIV